jgi:hypothetical protein
MQVATLVYPAAVRATSARLSSALSDERYEAAPE